MACTSTSTETDNDSNDSNECGRTTKGRPRGTLLSDSGCTFPSPKTRRLCIDSANSCNPSFHPRFDQYCKLHNSTEVRTFGGKSTLVLVWRDR